MMYNVAVIGGGIIGLATTRAILEQHPSVRLVQIEKETRWAVHQSSHNSGVVHSGIYYQPGSLKARLSVEGSKAMLRFCQENDLPHEICGKVVVATDHDELPQLEKLHERAKANGVPVRRMTPTEIA